jgi:hypothetical protein
MHLLISILVSLLLFIVPDSVFGKKVRIFGDTASSVHGTIEEQETTIKLYKNVFSWLGLVVLLVLVIVWWKDHGTRTMRGLMMNTRKMRMAKAKIKPRFSPEKAATDSLNNNNNNNNDNEDNNTQSRNGNGSTDIELTNVRTPERSMNSSSRVSPKHSHSQPSVVPALELADLGAGTGTGASQTSHVASVPPPRKGKIVMNYADGGVAHIKRKLQPVHHTIDIGTGATGEGEGQPQTRPKRKLKVNLNKMKNVGLN